MSAILDSFGARHRLSLPRGPVDFFRLAKLEEDGIAAVSRLPFSVKLVLESLLRSENGREVCADDVERLARYNVKDPGDFAVPYMPGRVLMQDFTGVPAVVDLAALRSAMARFGKDPRRINPQLPVDLVIDHSVQVDSFGAPGSLRINEDLEFSRNRERYEFLRWGQAAFDNFRVIPPGSGICHQVNLEYLAPVVQQRRIDGRPTVFSDTLVGTDSHTTMIGGLGVLGWGVGGIEAEAVMLGQPLYMLPPRVIGFKLTGRLPAGATATDLVLRITELLRQKGVVGCFVEFYGLGLSSITLADRATIANMAPEYGARCAFFPVDEETCNYLRYTARGAEQVELVETYCREQGLFRTDDTPDPEFADTVHLDISTVVSSLAGPKRPQDRVAFSDMKTAFRNALRAPLEKRGFALAEDAISAKAPLEYPDGTHGELGHGDVVIAAITSCTNTSNPYVMIGAGILAKKAVEAGLSVKPQVKTSLAPGSRVVIDYLDRSGLSPYLDKLGFHNVGFGCTTCIGNSGPLAAPIVRAIQDASLVTAAVLSGNRNFEGRVSPHTRANYLASPIHVVAYALAGTVDRDFSKEAVGINGEGREVFLKEIWPSPEEIEAHLHNAQDAETFRKRYEGIEESNPAWNAIHVGEEAVYAWQADSTYIQEPPFFQNMTREASPIETIENARVLVLVGDSTTTDHISPAGVIPADGPAGKYLIENGVSRKDFNSFGSRRGNDRVMTRGTFANIRLRNRLAEGREGGWTNYLPEGEIMSIFEAGRRYQEARIPTIILAGADYGMGSSRDWAAKGVSLLGVRAVIARSFETIHRANLVGMGVLPLQFKEGESTESLGLTGREVFHIHVDDAVKPAQNIPVEAVGEDGKNRSFTVTCRLDSAVDVRYYRHGGILHMVLRRLLA